MTGKYISVEELSKEIDAVITAELAIKEILKDHPRFSKERIRLDNEIKYWRELKKSGMEEYRRAKFNPEIKP
jgi:hypothetical protein